MSNGLLYIAGLLTLALAALFAVPYFVDWNGYRGVFEEEASRILGREVRVGGDVNLRLLPAPYVRFEKLRIADPSGTTGEPFFRAESFTLRLSVPPLLKGIFEANEIELKRPVLRLAVDADGGGNWRSLSIAPGSLPFIPADISLQSVKIKDGMVAVQGPKGAGVAEVDGLNGEFKADSIEGPFSFKGTAKWQGSDREVRVATGTADTEGGIQFKAIIRGSEHGNTYAVDGRALDLKGRPRFEGEVTAKFEIEGAPVEQASAPDGSPRSVKAEKAGIDFKATLAGDSKGLKLDGITVSFERLGQPQLINGNADATWSDALNVQLNLASRWLDLDKIAGSGGAKRPLETTQSFVSAVMDALPVQAETKVRIDIDQANLGGEAVSAIRLEAARSNGALLLKDLRAGLPGGAKLTLDGMVADVANARAFQGDLTLRGASLPRFLTWVAKDSSVADAVRSDGPFSLQGRLALSDKSVDLTDAGAEIGGRPLTGEVHYSNGERSRLSIAVDGQEIDASQLWPTAVGYLKVMLMGQPDAAKKEGASAPQRRWLDVATSDFSLRLRAAELKTERQRVSGVDLDLAIEKGQLSMRSCKFASDDGLEVDIEGDIADVTGQPRGALRWMLVLPGRDAFTSFVRLLELPDDASEQAMRYASLAPARLAGSIRLGERSPGAAEILADGKTEGGRVTAAVRLDGGLTNWRNAAADIGLTMESGDVVRAFDSLSARVPAAPAQPQQRPGEIFVKAVGTPAQGLLATASVKGPGLFFTYDGYVELPADGGSKFDGEVRVSARDVSDAMAIAGLGSGEVLFGSPIIGSLKLVSANHAIEVRPYKLTVGGSKVDGTIALAYPAGGPAIVTAQLDVDEATIPGLLGVVLDHKVTVAQPQPQQRPAEIAEPLTAGKTVWPESAFDFAALDGIEGKLGIAFGTLSLEPGMAIKNARLDMTVAPGKISVTKLEGKGAGGDVLATLALERAPGGANLAGDVRLNGIRLNAPAAAGAAQAKEAVASLALEFAGRGATPNGLIAVAMGQGAITLGDVTARVPTAVAVVATSEAALSGAAGGSGEALIAALREQMASSEVAVGPRKIAIAIADGAAKLEAFDLPSPAGPTKVETTVDLASLMVDSQWVLHPKAPDVERPDLPRKGALPAVSVVYVGPLKDAWALEPRITADQLERELAIRRMELDADQLERLHKLDAERARQEEERRRALAAEQARAAATPPPAAAFPAPPAAAAFPAPPPAAVLPPLPPAAALPAAPLPPNAQAPAPQAGQSDSPAPEVPELPPREESGAADVLPTLPGQEPALPQTGDPATATGELPPGAAEVLPAVPQGTYRPRRLPRQVPVGEQVLRALQNSPN